MPLPPPPRNPLRALVAPQTWLSTTHLVTDLPVGLAYFTVAVLGLLTTIVTLPMFGAGVLVFALTAVAMAMLAAVERTRFRLTTGVDIPAATLPKGRGWRRLLAVAVSEVTWRQAAHHVLLLPLKIATTVVGATAWALPLALLGVPLYVGSMASQRVDLWAFSVGPGPLAFVVSAVGGGLLLATPYVVHALAVVDAAAAKLLLGRLRDTEMAARIGQLERSRSRLVDAVEAERRRIERDLHDGAQQRLVSLAMNLGMARTRITDPEAAALVAAAHVDAKLAIVELRDLTRGIHPPVLTDLGLDAALSALAARCPTPVALDVDPALCRDRAARPSPTAEAIAYFVVAEALTNVARHARASHVDVQVRSDAGWLRLVIADDGVGGADEAVRRARLVVAAAGALPHGGTGHGGTGHGAPEGIGFGGGGTGLAGLADRLASVDGRLTVDSPVGGPTVLVAELPCAS